jgi:hypothetical protein
MSVPVPEDDQDSFASSLQSTVTHLGSTLEEAWPVERDAPEGRDDATKRRVTTARNVFRVRCFESNRIAEPSTTEVLHTGTDSVDLSNRLLGDTHLLPALPSLILMRDTLTSINLCRNRLSDKTAAEIIKGVMEPELTNVRSLDLSENKLGRAAVDALSCSLTGATKALLSTLKLRSCNLREFQTAKLLKALEGTALVSCELSDNILGDSGGECAGVIVELGGQHLKSLCLRDCRIRSVGFSRLAEALRHSGIEFLDVSKNSMGRGNAVRTTIEKLSQSLAQNTTLTHLNLEDNLITSQEDCAEIAEALDHNHSIVGLHIGGNNLMFSDAHGYVRPVDETNRQSLPQHTNACWLCDRWIPHTFTYGGEARAPLLHLPLDHDPATGTPMHRSGVSDWSLKRVVPSQAEVLYYVSSSGKKIIDPRRPLARDSTVCSNGVWLRPEGDPLQANAFAGLPRPEKAVEGVPVAQRPAWCLETSALRTFTFKASSKKAFTRDRLMKGVDTFRKLCRNDKLCDEICELCEEHHRILRDVFKWLAAQAFGSGTVISFSVDMASFLDFVNEVELGGDLPQSFITIAYTAALNILPGKPRDLNNSSKSLVRGEFIEALLRVAFARVASAESSDISAAVLSTFREMLLDRIISQGQRFDQDSFVKTRLYCQEVEDIWTEHNNLLHSAYKKHSGALAGPSDEHTMSLDEFSTLILQATQRDGYSGGNAITQRETTLAFILAKMPETDQEEGSNRDDATKLRWVEFLVALSIIAQFNSSGIEAFLHDASDFAIDGLPPLEGALRKLVNVIAETIAAAKKKKKKKPKADGEADAASSN